MKKFNLQQQLLLLLLILPLFASAQLTLKGKVMSDEEPVPFANIVLLNRNGNMEIGTTSEDDGSFRLKAPEGVYNLKVSYLGFEDWKQEIKLKNDMDVGSLALKVAPNNLQEITIIGKKKVIERRPDRLIFNLENNIAASGGSAIDALQLAPGVRVQNDQISMIGKSEMRVMVNGRVIPLSGEDLANYLTSISADEIKSIEIITNPPAKYQAEGNSGLLNIILKKGAQNSWSNSISGSYTQAAYGVYTLRNNFSYQKDKLRLLLSLNGGIGKMKIIESGSSFYPEGSLAVLFKRKDKEDMLTGRVELDYEISQNTTIGVQYLGNFNKPDSETTAIFKVNNKDNMRESSSFTDGFSDKNINNHSVNVHLISILDTLGGKLSIDLDYFDYDSGEERNFLSRNFSDQNVFTDIGLSALNISTQGVNNYSAKADVDHQINKLKLSYGGRISLIKNDSGIKFFNTITGSPVLESFQSNLFDYTEQVQAVYVSAAGKFNEKWQGQLGLRLENTHTEGISKTLNQVNKNSYLSLFPTVYVSYMKDDKNSFSFSYGRRINRPSYFLLNPFKIYVSESSYSTGNPFLKPSFNNNLELSYIFKNNLTSTLYIDRQTNGFGALPKVNPETNQQIVTRENFCNQNTYGFVESYVFNQIRWWESVNSVYLYASQTDYPEFKFDILSQSRLSYYFSSNNTFILNKAENLKVQINFWYNSPYVYGLFDYKQVYSLDFYLKYSLLQNRLQFSGGMNDIFKTSTNNFSVSSFGTTQSFNNYFSNRFFRFSMSYSFGNKKIKVNQRNFGNEEERGRAVN